MSKIVTLFGGEKSEQYNALMSALIEAGKDYAHSLEPQKPVDSFDDNVMYNFLDKTPKTSLTIEIVNKLNELGFEIKPIKK